MLPSDDRCTSCNHPFTSTHLAWTPCAPGCSHGGPRRVRHHGETAWETWEKITLPTLSRTYKYAEVQASGRKYGANGMCVMCLLEETDRLARESLQEWAGRPVRVVPIMVSEEMYEQLLGDWSEPVQFKISVREDGATELLFRTIVDLDEVEAKIEEHYKEQEGKWRIHGTHTGRGFENDG